MGDGVGVAGAPGMDVGRGAAGPGSSIFPKRDMSMAIF